MNSWNLAEQPRSSYTRQLHWALWSCAKQRLLARKLDIYRFFEKSVRIVLVRRGASLFSDPRIQVEQERFYLPMLGDEHEKNPLSNLAGVLSAFGHVLHAFFLALKLRRRGLDTHLVHGHHSYHKDSLALFLARLCRVPLVISPVDGDVNQMMRRNTPLLAIGRFVLSRADVTIAVSRPLQRALQASGVSGIYLSNSVDTTSVCPTRRSPRDNGILFVGIMTDNKRPLLLLRALRELLREFPG
jgi:glycosyltransferase involved in cell wall biosynthesis